jgi:hypothetical protein
MIDKAKLTLITIVLVAGFASPVFADCLESGAAESCGNGGYTQGADLQPYGLYNSYGMSEPYDESQYQ